MQHGGVGAFLSQSAFEAELCDPPGLHDAGSTLIVHQFLKSSDRASPAAGGSLDLTKGQKLLDEW